MPLALLITVFLIATCGLVYELIAGTLASYLLGDSVTQFSLVIGVYLFSMGVGSLLTQRIQRDLLGTFVRVELLIALLGGFSAAGLFWLFPRVESFRVVLFGLVSLIGILVGVEIPLLMRVLKDRIEFNRLVAQAGLADELRGSGPLTVFAPSDEAFKAVPAKTMEALAADPAQLKAVLAYHVIDGRMTAADVKTGAAKTRQGANIALAKAGSFVTVDDAVVQQADIVATNGVAHVVDRVLMPPKK